MSDVCNIPMNGGTLTPTGILVETRTVNEAWQEWFDMFQIGRASCRERV